VAVAAIVGLAQSTDLGDFPSIASVTRPRDQPEAGLGIASDVLKATLDGRRADGIVVLEAHGISLSSTPESQGSDETQEAAVSVGALSEAVARPPEFGQLLVVAEPWASVTVDGAEKGETPLTEMRLPAGSHEVVLSNPNYVGVIRDQVRILPAETIQRRYTFEDSGSLRILVKPWADVFVDGRFAGQTPLGALRVPPGKHTILLRHPELGEKSAIVEVLRNQESLLEVSM
jgi:hypothetical protein